MSRIIAQGEDLAITLDGDTLLHATDFTLTASVDLKDLRTLHTNGLEKSPGDISWSLKATGIVVIETISNTISAGGLLTATLAKKLFSLLMASDALENALKGSAYISDYELGATVGDNQTYSLTLTGSGNLSEVEEESE